MLSWKEIVSPSSAFSTSNGTATLPRNQRQNISEGRRKTITPEIVTSTADRNANNYYEQHSREIKKDEKNDVPLLSDSGTDVVDADVREDDKEVPITPIIGYPHMLATSAKFVDTKQPQQQKQKMFAVFRQLLEGTESTEELLKLDMPQELKDELRDWEAKFPELMVRGTKCGKSRELLEREKIRSGIAERLVEAHLWPEIRIMLSTTKPRKQTTQQQQKQLPLGRTTQAMLDEFLALSGGGGGMPQIETNQKCKTKKKQSSMSPKIGSEKTAENVKMATKRRRNTLKLPAIEK